ncbi:hypothetical protein PF005_g30488 [Phytophthora fragariae]|uniref:Uncharacterized protein n=1 Tax=Phytophthora fragariae TaxID=53985 RepID=A0A6A3VDE2_9STRA|nr:hypothetical protein PF005_g30488 [Phytophthora fragariae]
MDLLDAIRRDVLKQKEEEAMNYFSTVADFREFIMAAKSTPDVSVTVKMTCWTSERINGDHGTRVTLIDANQHAFYEATVESLNELTSVKRKPYIAQITVWDVKANKAARGVSGKPFMLFRPGAVYVFRQVDGVAFYADIPKGSVQFERGNDDKIVEVVAPVLKRKAPCAAAKKNAKAKTHELGTGMSSDPDDDEGDIVMDTECKESEDDVGVRTRSNTSAPP